MSDKDLYTIGAVAWLAITFAWIRHEGKKLDEDNRARVFRGNKRP